MAETSLMLAIGTAAWLGLLTSISPCPLATNVAAIAFGAFSTSCNRRDTHDHARTEAHERL